MATDALLLALAEARCRKEQADQHIRMLLAYARELATPRPYRLADLAAAAGMSISGIRTAYTAADIDAARRIMYDISGAQTAAEHSGDGSHDLPGPSR